MGLKGKTKGEVARWFFENGANCSQATLAAFAEEAGLSTDVALKLGSSFGGGMGRMRKTCGALTAAFMVLGVKKGYSNLDDINEKGKHYALIQSFAEAFSSKFGSTECRELLKTEDCSPFPTPRSDGFYSVRPCGDIIAWCADELEKLLAE